MDSKEFFRKYWKWDKEQMITVLFLMFWIMEGSSKDQDQVVLKNNLYSNF